VVGSLPSFGTREREMGGGDDAWSPSVFVREREGEVVVAS
jgi:hypothetical protein